MKDKSYSALSNAALRAAESYYPEDKRLFYDEVAFDLLPPLWKLFLKLMKFSSLREMIYAKRDKEMPGVIGNLLYRTRYIDDILKENIKEMEQLLILGAGFDTRAYRIEGIEKLEVFEVDQKIISFVEKVGSPWKTGIKSTEIGKILKGREMGLIEDVGREEYIKKYSNLTDREISIYAGERIAYAEKRNLV